MKFVRLLKLTILFTGFLMAKSQAQICQYTLNLYDDYGFGWSGSFVTVSVNGVSSDYTMPFPTMGPQPGSTLSFTIPVAQNNPIKLNFLANSPYGIGWTLLDNNADTITSQSPSFSFPGIPSGQYYSGLATCGGCPKPKNVSVNPFAYTAKLRWNSFPSTFHVVYGLAGFTLASGLGDTISTTQFKATLTGLYENTPYEAYILKECSDGSFSSTGPIKFTTYFSDDVGVSQVTSPVSDCELGFETVTILLKNYGANPQSLVSFFYSVDGVSAGVQNPDDGLYTGVLGKDSCEYIQFETLAELSGPGQHVIKVWTKLLNDDVPENDTVTYYLTNKVNLPYQESFEIWSGGWHIDYDKSNDPSWAVGNFDKPNQDMAADGENCWATNLSGNHNQGEESYLVSPCFDFSTTTVDPTIRFSLWQEASFSSGGLFLDISFDNGTTWKRVGANLPNNVGNWYNETDAIFGAVWANSTDWTTTRHKLDGAKGKPNVQLRFGFSGSEFFTQGGFGIDDIHIFEQKAKDATPLGGSSKFENCGLVNDKLTITVGNDGSQIIPAGMTLKLNYKVDNLATVSEMPTTFGVAINAEKDYTFTTPFNSVGQHIIKVWTELTGDENVKNDTTLIFINNTPAAKPLKENFEDQQIPDNWVVDFNTIVSNQHNNISFVLARNMYVSSPFTTIELPQIGPIETGDTLTFDYRITDFGFLNDGIVSTKLELTFFEVQVSEDCGQNWTTVYTINKTTHVPSVSLKKVKIGLNSYNGKNLKFQIVGEWGEGDFWFDTDNFNIKGCPKYFGLQIEANNDANQGMTLGSATVTPTAGEAPFTYTWSNGGTGNVQTNLPNGSYFVTVSDKNGCTDVAFVVIEMASGTREIDGITNFSIQPNPTNGRAMLSVDFENPSDAKLEVTNLLGQVQFIAQENSAVNLRQTIDLSNEAAGIYLVRLTVAGKTRIAKLILTK